MREASLITESNVRASERHGSPLEACDVVKGSQEFDYGRNKAGVDSGWT